VKVATATLLKAAPSTALTLSGELFNTTDGSLTVACADCPDTAGAVPWLNVTVIGKLPSSAYLWAPETVNVWVWGSKVMTPPEGAALPGDADLEAGTGGQLPAPAFDQGGIGAEVGDGGGDGTQVGAEDQRQAQQRRVDVERRQGVALGRQAVDARAGPQQPEQRPLAGDDDGQAALLDEGGVADELQGVAQALLGVQQDRLTQERSAVPAQLREGPRGQLLAAPALLVLGPAALEVAPQQPEQRAVDVGLAGVRVQPQGLLVASQGLVELPQLLQHQAQAVVGRGLLRPPPDRLPAAGERLVQFPEPQETHPQGGVGPGQVGPEPQGVLVMPHRLIGQAPGLPALAQQVPGRGVGRVRRQHLTAQLLGPQGVAALLALAGGRQGF
jgi:hypothetical protein